MVPGTIALRDLSLLQRKNFCGKKRSSEPAAPETIYCSFFLKHQTAFREFISWI